MWQIKDIKQRGMNAFRLNYWYCVLVALIITVCTGGSSGSASNSARRASGEEDIASFFSSLSPEVIAAIIGAVSIAILIGIAVDIFLFNPLHVSCRAFFTRNLEEPASLNELKAGFVNYKNNVITMLLRDVFVFLWSLLFLIPGIIKCYSYRMVPYILADDPSLSGREVIDRSREMMNGNKGRAFLMDLSFLGWILLSILTCGILAVLFVNPYIESSNAALYDELKNNQ